MRPAVVVLLAAMAFALGACGGSSSGGDDGHGAYAGALNRAQTELARRFSRLQARISATSTPAQDRRTLRAYEAAVDSTARRLRGVAPPAGLAPLHRRLVAEVGGYGVALRAARRQILSGDPRTVLAAQGRLGVAVARTERQLNATIAAINRKLEG